MSDSAMKAYLGTPECSMHAPDQSHALLHADLWQTIQGPLLRHMVLHVTLASGCRNCAFMSETACQTGSDMDRRPVLQVYEKLNTEGRFQEKLLEMYRWGKANGWDAAPSAMQ